MNIFEFMGVPHDHRKQNKVTQLVKHFDEVPESRKQGKDLVAQVKKDGVCALVVILKNNEVGIFSRTGNQLTNTQSLIDNIRAEQLHTGVYLGELISDLPASELSLEQLSGIVNPNRVNPLSEHDSPVPATLCIALFDVVDIDSFVVGTSQLPFYLRHSNLISYIVQSNISALRMEVLQCIPYYGDLCELVTGDGYNEEGIVIRDPNAIWEAGHKGWRAMKQVRGVDYDLQCIGYEEGTGKYKGKVANLIFSWKDGQIIRCMLGKGWTHAMAENMLTVGDDLFDVGNPIGKVFQVYALQESSKGKLRLPKVGELRHDKYTADI